MERGSAGGRPDAGTGTAQPRLADLRAVIRQLRTIPMPLREFGTTEEHAERFYALTGEMLTAAVGLGLPHVDSGASRYFDYLDLSNVSCVLRRPSAWALGQRGWAAGLAALRSGTRSCYELTLAPRCPFPGHRGPCDFSFLLAEADTEEPSDGAAGELISPGKLRVRTGSRTTQAPEHVRDVLAGLHGARYLHLPRELHHDLDYYRRTGSANCILAAEVLLQRARQRAVRARRSFGLVVLPPFAGLHTWVDFWVDQRWVAFDPHLIRFLERAGVLPCGHWPVDDSLSGLLLRLAPANTTFIRHNGMHCYASFRLVRTGC
jgi:Transglutaminase-like superfamily